MYFADKIIIVGKNLVINGISRTLCFISVIWDVCLKDLVKNLIFSIIQVGTRNN